jgi:signal transduction histidine kinase
MVWLREFLAAYQPALALLHGQVFFVLGFSIVFLGRRIAQLEIARGLTLIAVFGFCEALLAWSPAWFVSSSYPLAPWCGWLRLLVMGIGYAFLLAFAIQTYVPPERRQWNRWGLASGLFGLWLAGIVGFRLAGAPVERVWLGGEIAARYGLVLPAGLAGAWGLRRQAYRTIVREQLPLVKPRLRVAGVALGFFSLFGGLIGPPAPFFPANWLNEDTLLQVTGVPISLFRGLCGVAMTYGVVRALSVVWGELQAWLENMERMQALSRERERIGRELHDGTIQSIYAAGLMLEGARYSIASEPESARAQLTRAIESLNQTIKDIRRYIFDLRGELPDDDLEAGLRKILKDFRVNTLLETEFMVEGGRARLLGPERRQHVFQIARETLTNVARHAQARRVEVSLRYGANSFELRISDDGIGLAALPINGGGQGMRNIRERTRLLDGALDMHTRPNEGLTLTLTVPY